MGHDTEHFVASANRLRQLVTRETFRDRRADMLAERGESSLLDLGGGLIVGARQADDSRELVVLSDGQAPHLTPRAGQAAREHVLWPDQPHRCAVAEWLGSER